MKLLSPTNDVVFKLLFQRDTSGSLLRSMLESVLTLPAPIERLTILNPGIPKHLTADKPVFLDIRVDIAGSRRVDVEMQSQVRRETPGRFLYYWAREAASVLREGQGYAHLIPVVSVLWLCETLPQTEDFHTVFHVADDNRGRRLSDLLELHTLELPRLYLPGTEASLMLRRWARFFAAHTEQEFDELAREDDVMSTANELLKELSADEEAEEAARVRELSLFTWAHEKWCEREEGRAEGEAKGKLDAVRTLAAALGVPIDDERATRLASLSTEELDTVLTHLAQHRAWP